LLTESQQPVVEADLVQVLNKGVLKWLIR
jgi:hypothetical protein